MIRWPRPVANSDHDDEDEHAPRRWTARFCDGAASCAGAPATGRGRRSGPARGRLYCDAIGAAGATALGAADPVDCGCVFDSDCRSTCGGLPGQAARTMAATSAADIDRPCQLNVGGCWPDRRVERDRRARRRVIGRCGRTLRPRRGRRSGPRRSAGRPAGRARPAAVPARRCPARCGCLARGRRAAGRPVRRRGSAPDAGRRQRDRAGMHRDQIVRHRRGQRVGVDVEDGHQDGRIRCAVGPAERVGEPLVGPARGVEGRRHA